MATLPDTLGAGAIELRRARADHATDLVDAVRSSFVELNRWMPWAQSMPTAQTLNDDLQRNDAIFDQGGEWQFVMVEPESGAIVGGASLHDRGDGTLEIFYWVRTDRTRHGYATAAARALTDAAFDHVAGAERIEIRMDSANSAGAAIPRRLGYRLGGEVERDVRTTGQRGFGYVWSIDRASWGTDRDRPG
ncbi:MAG: GNAT family N-acetyltransferase [Acidimicrobiales bacterium]